MLQILADFDALLEGLDQFSADVETAKEAALDEIAKVALQEKNKQIDLTYARHHPSVAEYYAEQRKARAKKTAKRKAAAAKQKAKQAKSGKAPVAKKPAKPKATPHVDAAANEIPDKVKSVDKSVKKIRAKNDPNRVAWEVTGNWSAGQRMESSPGERRIIDTGPAATPITNYPGGYAQRLAKLPTGPDKVNRSNPAAERAMEIIEPQIEAIVETEITNALKL